MYQKIYCRDADLEVNDLPRNAAAQSAPPAGSSGASSVTVSAENVEYLTSMGFSEPHARFALQQTVCFSVLLISLSFYVISPAS